MRVVLASRRSGQYRGAGWAESPPARALWRGPRRRSVDENPIAVQSRPGLRKAVRKKPSNKAVTFLPIVEVTLRQAARKPRTYWSRVTAVALPSLFLLPPLFFSPFGPGRPFGAGFAWLAFWLVLHLLTVAMRSTADSISREKREGTLGLLFLTDLKGHDIVLGKLVGACSRLFASWLAMLPLACILILAGGVTWLDVLRFMLAIGNTLFFGAAAGLLASAIYYEEKRALKHATSYIVTTCLFLPLLGYALQNLALVYSPGSTSLSLKFLGTVLLTHSPGPAILGSFGYSAFGGGNVWLKLLVTHLFAWGIIGLASWFAPRRWQDKPAKPSRAVASSNPDDTASLPDPWDAHFVRERALKRAEALDANPFAWLISRASKSAYGNCLAGIVAIGIGAFLWWLDLSPLALSEVCVCIALVVHIVVKAGIAEAATRGIHNQKTTGALEQLLLTGLTPRDIIAGQRLALSRAFKRPVIVLLTLDLVFLAASVHSLFTQTTTSQFSGEWSLLCFAWSYLFVTMAADVPALFWAGIWESLRSKKN